MSFNKQCLHENYRKQLDTQGFFTYKSFTSKEECREMKEFMRQLVQTDWHPDDTRQAGFTTTKQQESIQGKSDYFLDSADRVHFFAETYALDESTGKLKEEYKQNKVAALNKVGHGLHLLEESPFYNYTTSLKMKHLLKDLGWIDPVVPQSMYIFKHPNDHINNKSSSEENPNSGNVVTSHQDSTFLYTEPRQTCLGLWLALDKATLENGCLWVRPGSNQEGVRRKFVRNPKYFSDGDDEHPKLIFEDLNDPSSMKVSWEGSLPENSWPLPCDGLHDAGFIPVDCEVGDLVVFVGTTDHLSLPNYSKLPRDTFQLHLIDGIKSGCSWSKGNWLQYGDDQEFLSLAL